MNSPKNSGSQSSNAEPNFISSHLPIGDCEEEEPESVQNQGLKILHKDNFLVKKVFTNSSQACIFKGFIKNLDQVY
jgi:hypothetical protein